MTQSYEMDHISVSSTWTTDQVSVDILPNAYMKTIWTVKGRGSKKRWGLGGNEFFWLKKRANCKENKIKDSFRTTSTKQYTSTHTTLFRKYMHKNQHMRPSDHTHTPHTHTHTHTKMIHYMHKYITCADMQGWIYGTHAPLKPYLYNTLRVCHVTLYRTSHHWIPNIDNGNFLSFLKIVSNSALSSRPLPFFKKIKNKKATCQINTLRRSPTSFLLILIYKRQSLTSCQGCWGSPYK